jgi:hypothetical protein
LIGEYKTWIVGLHYFAIMEEQLGRINSAELSIVKMAPTDSQYGIYVRRPLVQPYIHVSSLQHSVSQRLYLQNHNAGAETMKKMNEYNKKRIDKTRPAAKHLQITSTRVTSIDMTQR